MMSLKGLLALVSNIGNGMTEDLLIDFLGGA